MVRASEALTCGRPAGRPYKFLNPAVARARRTTQGGRRPVAPTGRSLYVTRIVVRPAGGGRPYRQVAPMVGRADLADPVDRGHDVEALVVGPDLAAAEAEHDGEVEAVAG
jgi:hypothetical protein